MIDLQTNGTHLGCTGNRCCHLKVRASRLKSTLRFMTRRTAPMVLSTSVFVMKGVNKDSVKCVYSGNKPMQSVIGRRPKADAEVMHASGPVVSLLNVKRPPSSASTSGNNGDHHRPSILDRLRAVMSRVRVTRPPGLRAPTLREHWANAAGTSFKNPWPSFKQKGALEVAKMVWDMQFKSSQASQTVDANVVIPQVKPTFGVSSKASQIKATWLGHACYLVEMPGVGSQKGVTVLFDPVFSQRCSPFSFMGPGRFTQPPCKVEDLPEVDVIVISHNHYDHTDLPTLASLYKQQKASPPHLFLPLNTARSLTGLGIAPEGISQLDWWEARDVAVEHKGSVRVTCTPCQHFTGRGILDRNESLWASWAIEGLVGNETKSKVWFGGDTGYCSVDDDDSHGIELDLPTCPAFKEIGERFGGFDLGLIPIGAYAPRSFMSPIHNAPIDSVRMFKDIKCKKALGIHWGTWRLTSEPIDEPPQRLATARDEVGLAANDFETCAIGETRVFDVDP